LARRAGLGWFGKNTNLINPERGSFFFIGSLFVALALEPSTPFDAERCGRCTRCLDACPTGAFDGPHVLDARRCVSYLTIEHRAAIPDALQAGIGELLYGCDVCQDVCPWNVKFSRPLMTPEFTPRPPTAETDARLLARSILTMDATEYARAFKGSAIKRAKLWMLQRNAAVVLGNVGDARDVGALESILGHEHNVVRAQAQQAIAAIARRTAADSPESPAVEDRTG
ncbi:MAG: tRNA epoxyqueuosine(34) reductase QueG, partial [Gemmatimonadota bacterium]